MPDLPHYEDEEEEDKGGKVLNEFECPECAANNPYDDGIRPGDEVRCYYCGLEFRAEKSQEGKWRFREI